MGSCNLGLVRLDDLRLDDIDRGFAQLEAFDFSAIEGDAGHAFRAEALDRQDISKPVAWVGDSASVFKAVDWGSGQGDRGSDARAGFDFWDGLIGFGGWFLGVFIRVDS